MSYQWTNRFYVKNVVQIFLQINETAFNNNPVWPFFFFLKKKKKTKIRSIFLKKTKKTNKQTYVW